MANPWQMRKCQYRVHSAIKNVARIRRVEATINGSLRCPISNNRPVIRPGKKIRAFYQRLMSVKGAWWTSSP